MRAIIIYIITLLSISVSYAQYLGDSYLRLSSGIAIEQSNTKFSDASPFFELGYGYILSQRVTLEGSLDYKPYSDPQLKGHLVSLSPTAYYSLYQRDRLRFDLGGVLRIGFESLSVKNEELVESDGNLQSFVYGIGLRPRLSYLLRPKLGITLSYQFTYQQRSLHLLDHRLGLGLNIYL